MIAFSIVLLPLIWTGRYLSRPEGLALIMGYAAYLWLLWP
jgi:Ca2+/Na+ antiporter